jgi:hypothetical protein
MEQDREPKERSFERRNHHRGDKEGIEVKLDDLVKYLWAIFTVFLIFSNATNNSYGMPVTVNQFAIISSVAIAILFFRK